MKFVFSILYCGSTAKRKDWKRIKTIRVLNSSLKRPVISVHYQASFFQ